VKNETVAVVLVVALVLAFLAGLGSSMFLLKGNRAPSSTSSSTVLTMCTIPDEGQVIMQVLNSTNGRPIPSAPVQADFLAPECPPNSYTTVTMNTTLTNSTGYVTFGGEVGEWSLRVDGSAYSVSVTTLPGQIACVTLGVPSGETHIVYSGFLEPSCRFGF